MQDLPGIFIVLEGADGSGKTTQFELLGERLKKAGYRVAVFDFPRYDNSSSYFVKRYLNGEYGPAASINPYTASLFYALDRFEAGPDIRKALADGKVVLSNRYVGSNMAHQGSKFSEPIEKRSFFVWEDSLEYQLLNIPRPDINLFLRVPADVSYQLISRKNARSYTNKTHDEHEKDINHLKRSVETYDLLCQLFPRDFKAIECAPEGELLPIEPISDLIWEQLSPLLPKRNPGSSPKPEPAPTATQVPETKPEPTVIDWNIEEISLFAVSELKLRGIHLKTSDTWRGQKGKYKYFVPEELSEELKKRFVETIEKMASQHQSAHAKLSRHLSSRDQASDMLAAAVPLAATVQASAQIDKLSALEVLERLSTSQTPEVVRLTKNLTSKIRQRWPDVWREHRNQQAELTVPEAIGSIMEKLSIDMLPQKLAPETELIKLIEATPRNEFELLADSLYPYSNLSRPEITSQIENWDYQQKFDALKLALGKPRAEALKLARYRFDLLTDWLTLMDVASLGLANDIQLQPATPRFGYEVPEAIEASGAEDEYMEMFDQSLSLYSHIQPEAADTNLVEYAILRGHRLRWQASFAAETIADAARISKLPATVGILLPQLLNQIKEVHPTIGEQLSRPRSENQPAKKTAGRPGRAPKRKR
jgi:dTMP kinase